MRVPIVGYILVVLIAYLLGSIPTGFLVAKARGVDIRTVGSGNIGATNVFRILGKPAGVFVLLADAAKGWLAVSVVASFFAGGCTRVPARHGSEWFQLCAGVAAILGHNYTCWLLFQGRQGHCHFGRRAGRAGAAAALLIMLGIWIVVFALTRYVSLASISAAFVLPFAVLAAWREPDNDHRHRPSLAALAIYKHKANIKRLHQRHGEPHRTTSRRAC